nr:MFS transporter [uncultured Sphaerochaeta sp.]
MGSIRFIWYKGMQNLILVYPVYPLLFSKAGLSLSQISLLLAIWSIPVILLEIPSGVLADRWSRRYLLIISGVLRTLCFTIWLVLPPTFFVYALGFLAWGTAEALSSGAEEALLFDTLKLEGRQEAFETIYGRGMGTASVAVALSCFTGGFVAQRFGFPIVLLVSVIASLSATGIVMGSNEVNLYKRRQEQHTSLSLVKEALVHISKKRSHVFMVLLLIIPISLPGVLDEYDPLIASSYGVTTTFVGFWTGGRYLLESLGAFAAQYVSRKRAKVPVLLCISGGVSLLLYAVFEKNFFLPLYFLFYFFLSAAGIIQENVVQQSIEDQGRSTIHSYISLATDLHAMLVFLLLGTLVSINHIIFFVALYGVIVSFLLFLGQSKTKKA